MAILITSGGQVITGTEGADDIRLSGGITGNSLVINSLAGNDTIVGISNTITGGVVGAGVSVNAAGGADSISMTISGATQSASNPIILGGAGRDTIAITGGLPQRWKYCQHRWW